MNNRGPWYVYDLIDPRDKQVFYVGCTSVPLKRYIGHLHDPASVAYWRFHDTYMVPKMDLIQSFDDKHQALAAESKRIRETPSAINPSRKYIWDHMSDAERMEWRKKRAKPKT
jgi:predicted GIY-YIG superfamily endonuclease